MVMKNAKLIISSMILLALLAISPVALVAASANAGSAQAAPGNIIPVTSTESSSPTCSPSGLCPTMLETAYNVTALHNAGVDGAGQSVVIVDACSEPNIASDLKVFDKQFHLPTARLNVYYPQGKCTTDYGWGLEISLDVEWSHVMAPNATINLVIANQPSFSDLFGAWKYALSHHLGNEISNSWGGSQACVSSINKILDKATAANVTVLAASGDGGAWPSGSGFNPANCVQVLTVGGTSLTVTSAGKYKGESAWGGSGGGYVTGTKEPSYQSSVNIKDPHHLLGKPDVAAVANPATGVWVYNTNEGYGWVVVGGTSVACPLWASFLADVNQIRASNSYHPAGFVTPFLYETVYGVNGTSPLYHADMHDIKTGSNGFPAGKGWDAATGIGSFNVGMLAFTIGDSPTA